MNLFRNFFDLVKRNHGADNPNANDQSQRVIVFWNGRHKGRGKDGANAKQRARNFGDHAACEKFKHHGPAPSAHQWRLQQGLHRGIN